MVPLYIYMRARTHVRSYTVGRVLIARFFYCELRVFHNSRSKELQEKEYAINCERSELSGLFNARIFYINYIPYVVP